MAATVAGILHDKPVKHQKRNITDVAAHLRIAERHLAALGSSQMDGLPGTTYAVSLFDLMQNFLAPNPEAMAEQFKREMGIVDTKPVPNYLSPPTIGPSLGGFGLYLLWLCSRLFTADGIMPNSRIHSNDTNCSYS